MSPSYRAVFIISIVMIFFVIVGGIASGSKSFGLGIWYWGYIAWKMYKRDNESLISLQKILLYFEAVAFPTVFIILLFSNSETRRYTDVSPMSLVIFATISMVITYLLYKFFRNQQIIFSNSLSELTGSLIEDRYWEQASRELNGVRHEATWARALASADGDSAKTKAIYLRLRASDLRSKEFRIPSGTNFTKKPTFTTTSSVTWFGSYIHTVGKVLILILFLLGIYTWYDLSKKNITSNLPSETSHSNSPSNTPQAQQSNITKGEAKNILCLYLWDESIRRFVRLNSDINDMSNFTNILIFKPGKQEYVEKLVKQLRKADSDGNEDLARSIAKTVRENVITIYYPRSLSDEFIKTLAEELNLYKACVN
jgi:hypothetical protein